MAGKKESTLNGVNLEELLEVMWCRQEARIAQASGDHSHSRKNVSPKE